MTTLTVPLHRPLSADRRTGFSRHAFIVPSIFISLCVCFWFATWGEGDLFYPEHLCGFYDAQARSLLAGRLDVPPAAIEFEAFVHDGKTYGYFGIAPALVHLPLVILFPKMDGCWSRLLMLCGVGAGLICAYRIALHAGVGELNGRRKLMMSLFILAAGAGATPVFIVSRCYVYHEAILWGAVFSLLFAERLITYLKKPKVATLVMAGIFSFLAFHSRATGGAGTVAALCVLSLLLMIRTLTIAPMRNRAALQTVDRPRTHAFIAVISIIVIVGTYLAVNYGRFGTFDGVPVRYYRMYMTNPIRMKITGGRQFHLENLPTSFSSYFGGRSIQFRPEFPWVYMVDRARVIGTPALDVVEPYASVPWAMPALFALSVAGIWPVASGRSDAMRQFRLPATALLLGSGVALCTVGITQRYLHDFYPWLIVFGAAGLARMIQPGVSNRKIAVLLLLTLVSIANTLAFSLVFQREIVWGVPQVKQQELTRMRAEVDRYFGKKLNSER